MISVQYILFLIKNYLYTELRYIYLLLSLVLIINLVTNIKLFLFLVLVTVKKNGPISENWFPSLPLLEKSEIKRCV